MFISLKFQRWGSSMSVLFKVFGHIIYDNKRTNTKFEKHLWQHMEFI